MMRFVPVLLCCSCYTMNAELPGTLRDDIKPADLEIIGSFSVERTHYFALDGLVGRPPIDMFSHEIKAQVQRRGGDGVANLVYESEHTCGDVAFGICTFGCLSPRTYRLHGDIVRIRAQRLPGRPAKLVDAGAVVAQRW
jgi:hypothetical protein